MYRRHGLSLYIETEQHNLLLDTGQTDAVVKNAEALGIDLTAVDTVILSHGHYDHSGGILPFSQINRTAQIIMQHSAAKPHYNGERYIGIDQAILDLPNTRLIDGDLQLDDELFLFSGITGRRCYPQGNRKLFRIEDGVQLPDDFDHEQCLVIQQNGKHWLPFCAWRKRRIPRTVRLSDPAVRGIQCCYDSVSTSVEMRSKQISQYIAYAVKNDIVNCTASDSFKPLRVCFFPKLPAMLTALQETLKLPMSTIEFSLSTCSFSPSDSGAEFVPGVIFIMALHDRLGLISSVKLQMFLSA